MNELIICLAGLTIVTGFVWLGTPERSKWYRPLEIAMFVFVALSLVAIAERMWFIHTHF